MSRVRKREHYRQFGMASIYDSLT